MNIILLSGGSGTRLWPLSNEVRSKQFIKIFKTPTGRYESMLQRVCRQLRALGQDVSITVATSKTQVSAIRSQLGDEVGICVEPCRKDTFAAIALAAAYLHDVKRVSLQETVIVCPVDPYVEKDYFEAFRELDNLAKRGDAALVLMGIEPSHPSEKYGYIIPENKKYVSKVMEFKEKPDTKEAERCMAKGALWNGGVFAFQISYVLNIAQAKMAFIDYWDLYSRYDTLDKISFDYAVVEKEKSMQVMRFSGQWKDLGTWNTLTEAMQENVVGNAVVDTTCRNVHIVNELDIPVLCMGLENVVISASPEGILAADKKCSVNIKPLVEQMDRQVMFTENFWGTYRVLDVDQESLAVKATLNAGEQLNYHNSDRKDEVLVVVSGRGKVYLDGVERCISAGDAAIICAGCYYTIIAETELKVIEVRFGIEKGNI